MKNNNIFSKEKTLKGSVNLEFPFIAKTREKECIEANLKNTEVLLKNALNNSTTTVFSQDRNLKYTWICNPQFDFLGHEIIGKTDWDIFQKEDAENFAKIKKNVLKTGVGREDEIKVTINNEIFYCTLRTEPIVNQNKKITGITCSLADITRLKNVEEYLRKEQYFTKKILETVPDTIYIIDLLKNQNLFINRQLPLGYSNKELEKWKNPAFFLRLVYPSDQEKVKFYFNKLLVTKDQNIQDIEFRILDKNRNWRWVETRNIIFEKDENGKARQILGMASDITSRKISEKELRRSEERYALAQRAANIGSWDWDVKSGNLKWSERVEPIFGLKNGEFDGKMNTFLKLIYSKDRKKVIDAVQATLKKEANYDIDHRIIYKKDGSIRWVRETGDVIRDEGGNAKRMIGIVQDITEKKKMEESLKERDDWLQAIIDNSGSIIYAKDIKGRYILFNKKCEVITGFKRKDVLGKKAADLFPKKYADTYTVNDLKVIKTKQMIQIEEEAMFKDRPFVALTVKFPIFDSIGNIKAVCAIGTDITEIKELEVRKDNFISMASHELKTPITSIKVFTQILQKMPQYNIAGKYLERLDEQVNKLTTLVNDLLDVSKIQTGKLQLGKSNFWLDEMVNESVEISQATTRKHNFIIERNPKLKIYADKDRVGQVFSNLLSNAIKYTPKGGDIIVNVSKNKKNVTVSIKDFGVGVPKRYQDRIFNRFFRVYKEKDKTFPGLGMGLYISYDIIKRHHGDMWVKSEKGKGSTFYFRIPTSK